MNEEEKRGPGNLPGENHRTSAEERQQRITDVVDLVARGFTKRQIREKLELDDTTLFRVMRDLDLATVEVAPQTVELYLAYRAREADRLETQRQQVLESASMRPRDKHVLLLQIHDRLAALLNLSSESLMPADAEKPAEVRRIIIESVPCDAEPEVVDTTNKNKEAER